MRSKRFVVLLNLVWIGMLLVGCVGQHARTEVLLPTMQAVWPGIRADAERGGAEAEMLLAYDIALAEKNQISIIALWPAIKLYAEAGIDLMPVGLAASLTERVNLFDESVNKLVQRLF